MKYIGGVGRGGARWGWSDGSCTALVLTFIITLYILQPSNCIHVVQIKVKEKYFSFVWGKIINVCMYIQLIKTFVA